MHKFKINKKFLFLGGGTIIILVTVGIFYLMNFRSKNVQIDYQSNQQLENTSENERVYYMGSQKIAPVDVFGYHLPDFTLHLDPIPGTGVDDVERYTFTTDNNGEYNLTNVPVGAYRLVLPGGWYFKDPDTFEIIDLRNGKGGGWFIVTNEDYEKEARKKYYWTVQEGDTLWSIAETHYGDSKYWPLLARDNKLAQNNGTPSVRPGDEIFLQPLTRYGVTLRLVNDENLRIMANAFYAGDFQKNIVNVNNNFSYQLTYPGYWIVNEVNLGGGVENLLHQWAISGLSYRKELTGNLWKKSVITVKVYDNTSQISLNDFLITNNISQSTIIDYGHVQTEQWVNGGILMTGGYITDEQHLFFFKGNLIYDVSFPPLVYLERTYPALFQEVHDIISSFTLIDGN